MQSADRTRYGRPLGLNSGAGTTFNPYTPDLDLQYVLQSLPHKQYLAPIRRGYCQVIRLQTIVRRIIGSFGLSPSVLQIATQR